MGGIFISYRRSDSQGEAGRLFDDLVQHFDENTVFMDVSAIEAGRDFRKAIEEGVTKCGVLLVVMGPEWVTAKDEKGARRLDDSGDFVRIETASALRRDIPVIPVLVRNAKMPGADVLPDDLKDLAFRNCIELTHARWRSDVLLLIESLHRLLGSDIPAKAKSGARPAANTTREVNVASGGADVTSARNESSAIDASTIERVTRELAHHIGPIAAIVVKRAAAQSTSPEVLYRKVAEEIDAPQERDRFLKQAGIGSSASTSPAVIRQNDSKPSPSAPPVPAKQLDTQPIRAASQIKTKPGSSEKYAIVAGAIALAFLFLFALPPVRRAIFGSNADSSKRSRSPEPLQEKQERREEKRAESAPEAAKTEIPKPSAEAAKPDQPKPSTRVSVPAEEMQGRLERKVLPVYPQLARQAHIQGEVIFDADIAKDGVVETLRTVSGHPLLLPAAVDAVKQWRYKPYLHNGEPVAVDTKIVVSFTLK